MNCSKCGTLINEGDKFCSKCGAVVEIKPTFCSKCGQALTSDAKFCPKCGDVISSETFKYAGFWLRVGAMFLDSILLSIVTLPVSIFSMFRSLSVLPNLLDPTELLLTPFGKWTLPYFIPSFIGLVYFVICHSYGQTLGKKIAGIKVIRDGGDRPGFGWALLRETVGRFLAAVALCLGYMWVGWDKNKQGWHDKIAGTFVIKV